MKKCPACDKTFEDSMRFCQVDGTPLVDDAPAFDPYATIVGKAVTPKPSSDKGAVDTPSGSAAGESGAQAITPPDDVLDVPEADPLKTMYVSDAEMMATLGKAKPEPEPEPEIIEVPPIETDQTAQASGAGTQKSSSADVPSFNVPEAPKPGVQDLDPPPSPFSPAGAKSEQPVPTPPKFDEPKLEEPKFDEAATMIQSSLPTPFEAPPGPAKWTPPPPGADLGKSFDPPAEKKSPFDPVPSAPMEAWTPPPPPPEPSWQNKEAGSAAAAAPSFQPAGGGEGENKGLAIGSLVAGILSCLCCFSVITGPAAVIMGFIAKKKADEEPTQYGGRSLALGGMITGAIGFVIGIVLIILQVFFGALSALAQ